MPTNLQILQRQQRRRRPETTRAAPRAGATFHEVARIPTPTPVDAWGGWDGKGWGPAGSLWVTSGARQGNRDLHSRVWRLDTPDGQWADDGAPRGSEVLNKIRNGTPPGGGEDRLWVFFESPKSSQRILISRRANSGWEFEGGVPADDPAGGTTVGGRGLAIPSAGGRVLVGGSYNWDGAQQGRVFEMQASGSWSQRRQIAPSLMWEIEFDPQGRVWEFFNNFNDRVEAHLFVNGSERDAPPGGDISSANWFPVSGHMYTIGRIGGPAGDGGRNDIHRSTDGNDWERVHTATANRGDHVLYVPRGDGEMWATYHNPFEVYYSLDGLDWNLEPTIPSFQTGDDTNHMTAIAYWQGAIWVMSRDSNAGNTRVFTDFGEGGNGGGQPPDGGPAIVRRPFPALVIPPRPPELPTVPPAFSALPPGHDPLRNDALTAAWIEDFERMMREAWTSLATIVGQMEARLAAIETSVRRREP